MILRVIAGSARKRRLKAPPGRDVRPTADRVKEALFNILAERIGGCTFLDLFAGTGGVGIEALSRGAEEAVFVEKDARVIKVLQDNLSSTGLAVRAEIIRNEIEPGLRRLGSEGRQFELVFMDPPYGQGLTHTTMTSLVKYNLIKSQGLVVVETGKQELLPAQVAILKLYRQVRYGDTLLSFYRIDQSGEEVDNIESGNISR